MLRVCESVAVSVDDCFHDNRGESVELLQSKVEPVVCVVEVDTDDPSRR